MKISIYSHNVVKKKIYMYIYCNHYMLMNWFRLISLRRLHCKNICVELNAGLSCSFRVFCDTTRALVSRVVSRVCASDGKRVYPCDKLILLICIEKSRTLVNLIGVKFFFFFSTHTQVLIFSAVKLLFINYRMVFKLIIVAVARDRGIELVYSTCKQQN